MPRQGVPPLSAYSKFYNRYIDVCSVFWLLILVSQYIKDSLLLAWCNPKTFIVKLYDFASLRDYRIWDSVWLKIYLSAIILDFSLRSK